jgi:polar amino acid transport system permease protein
MDINSWKMLWEGALTTVGLSVCSIVAGVTLGLLIGLVRLARVPFLSQFLALYISLIRATPVLTLTLAVFIAAPSLGLDVSLFAVGVIALTLNTMAFNAEIWRTAFASFPREQLEAAKSAGMTPWLCFRRIVLPQVTVSALPGLVNEMSGLIKGSPAVAVIGIVELTRVTNRIAAETYEPLPSIIAAAVVYMAMIFILVRAQRYFEQYAQRLAG